RFRELSVVANAQPLWAMNDAAMSELTVPFLGSERAGWQYPFGSLERAGAQIAIGIDWPVSSPNPLLLMHVAVNRSSWETGPDVPAAEREVFLGSERLTLASALRAATLGSAYGNHLDAVTGSVEVGKLADLVVLDRNIFAEPASEIAQARVDQTFVEGTCVFGG
ncbi:MAG: amidohydrolase family protein, partial [Jiangellaceae bacterium]